MQPKVFVAQLDHKRIRHAIVAAEQQTSGEIRAFVARAIADDPVRSAQREFEKLKMHQTRHRNGVLIYVAPSSQAFAIIGDAGVHEKCGQTFWGTVAEAMRGHFKQGKFTEGIEHGICEAGRILAEHFPREKDDQNELPDDIVEQ